MYSGFTVCDCAASHRELCEMWPSYQQEVVYQVAPALSGPCYSEYYFAASPELEGEELTGSQICGGRIRCLAVVGGMWGTSFRPVYNGEL